DFRELLGGRVEPQELPRAAELAKQPIGLPLAGNQADTDARRPAAVGEALGIVWGGTDRRGEGYAQGRRLRHHRHVPRFERELPFPWEVLHLLEQQLRELHARPSRRSLLLRGPAFFCALQPRRLALQLAQIEQARALHLAAGDDLDLVDARRIEREDALDAHAVAHLSHGERRVRVTALAPDDHALEDLDPVLVAFADLRMHAHGVADAEFRNLAPDFRRDVPLLHQLDRLPTHLRTLCDYRSPKNNSPSSLLLCEQIEPALACARHRFLPATVLDL